MESDFDVAWPNPTLINTSDFLGAAHGCTCTLWTFNLTFECEANIILKVDSKPDLEQSTESDAPVPTLVASIRSLHSVLAGLWSLHAETLLGCTSCNITAFRVQLLRTTAFLEVPSPYAASSEAPSCCRPRVKHSCRQCSRTLLM